MFYSCLWPVFDRKLKREKKKKEKQQKDPTERMRLCDNAWSVHGPLMRALVFMLFWRFGGGADMGRIVGV